MKGGLDMSRRVNGKRKTRNAFKSLSRKNKRKKNVKKVHISEDEVLKMLKKYMVKYAKVYEELAKS